MSGKANRRRRRKPPQLTAQNLRLLKIYPSLPPTAVIPIPVAGLVRGLSDKTIRRRYPTVAVSDGRVGVRKEVLEAGPEAA